MPKVDFRQFQEWEVMNKASRAKMHMQGRDTAVEMVAAHDLGGLLKMDCGLGILAQSAQLALAHSLSPNRSGRHQAKDLASVLLFCLCQNSTKPPTTTFHAPDDHQDGMQPPCPPQNIFSVCVPWPVSRYSEPLIPETDEKRFSALVPRRPRPPRRLQSERKITMTTT